MPTPNNEAERCPCGNPKSESLPICNDCAVLGEPQIPTDNEAESESKYVWQCSNCGETVSHPDTLATKEFHCPQCGKPLVAILPPQSPTESGEVLRPHTPLPWGIERTDTHNWIGPLRKNGDGKVSSIVCSTDREDLNPIALARNDADAELIVNSVNELETLRRRCGELELALYHQAKDYEDKISTLRQSNKPQSVLERELELVTTALGKEKSENNRLALQNCGLAKRILDLENSNGGLVGALLEIRDNPNCIPPELADKALSNAQSLPTDNI